MNWNIIQGDCLEVLKSYPDNHFSAIVTDPPYGLSFMNKGWDHSVPGIEYWTECLRVAKPGGYLLAMGGTRTFHRLCCAIEDSGFEVRDTIMWLYGQGFPKSHNHFGILGYGTALKPAVEPIIMAMKPCEGTFKQNAEKWGQAGINIDECRIGITGGTKRSEQFDYPKKEDGTEDRSQHWARIGHSIKHVQKGRWPANVILDEEAAEMLDAQSGMSKSIYSMTAQPVKTSKGCIGGGFSNHFSKHPEGHKKSNKHIRGGFSDFGGASRFFYCAKASSSERGEDNRHPTVKPLKLMEYLIKLVMPPTNGLLLDPFAGSGTTILAAKRLGFSAIGIEKQAEYCEIARKRIESSQMSLFE